MRAHSFSLCALDCFDCFDCLDCFRFKNLLLRHYFRTSRINMFNRTLNFSGRVFTYKIIHLETRNSLV